VLHYTPRTEFRRLKESERKTDRGRQTERERGEGGRESDSLIPPIPPPWPYLDHSGLFLEETDFYWVGILQCNKYFDSTYLFCNDV
jgi:hypothetical protein